MRFDGPRKALERVNAPQRGGDLLKSIIAYKHILKQKKPLKAAFRLK